ncbi:MAG: HAD family phosphatase [Clostridia bacterium]
MKITGAIFDLDGTILDSMGIWENLGRDYLKLKGKIPREDLADVLECKTLQSAAEYFIEEYKINLTPKEIIDEVNLMIKNYYIYKVKLKPYVIGFLKRLKKENVHMCVATASDKKLAEEALLRCNVLNLFDDVLTCQEMKCGKDKPKIYNEALKKIGTKKNTTYVFEDALYAVTTAKKAGFKVVGVFEESEYLKQDEIKNIADIYINSFKEMSKYLD